MNFNTCYVCVDGCDTWFLLKFALRMSLLTCR